MNRYLCFALLGLAACDGGKLSQRDDPDGGGMVMEGGAVEAGDFCAALSEIVCAANAACCGGVVAGETTCEAQQLEACEDTVAPLLEDPRVAYVPERGGEYLDGLRAQAEGCFAEPPQLSEFLTLFAGTGVEGADCTPSSTSDDRALRISQLSCADGLACHLYRRSDGSAIGVCEPPEDDACSHRFDCGAGSWCNLPDGWAPGRWGDCQPLKANGWGCTSDLECASLECDSTGMCADPLEARYCAARSYEDAVLSHVPLGYWRLGDAGSETATDRSPSRLHGAYGGGPMSAMGAIMGDEDGAMKLDGVDDVVSIEGLRFSGAPMTLECWFRRSPMSTTGPLLEFAESAEALGTRLWSHNASDKVHVNFFDGEEGHATTSAEGVVAADIWVHVAATYDGAVGRLYVDGQRVGEPIEGAFEPSTAGILRIGLRLEDERHVTGAIDEVAVYDRALSQAQIREHHRIGSEGPGENEFVLFRWLR